MVLSKILPYIKKCPHDRGLCHGKWLGRDGTGFLSYQRAKGNIEYLIYLDKKQPGATKEEVHTWVEEIVAKSHEVL